MEHQHRVTSLEQWRDVALANPWPVGLALLCALWLLILFSWPRTPDSQIDLVSEYIVEGAPDERVLDASKPDALPADGVITAKRIRVIGNVLLNSPAVLVANEIVFDPNSRVRVPSGDLVVIAPRITNGVFDVSGNAGAAGRAAGEAGHDGGKGGSAYVASGEFAEVSILANGGVGGDGQRGYAGAAGRNGYCGPRGFVLVERGKVGGNGGDAGEGGSAGVITAWYGVAAPQLTADPGLPGKAARGGPGGRGGAGCRGVRGSQPAQSAGNEGATGQPGSPGAAGTTSARHVKFSAVVEAYEDWLADRADQQELRDRLARLPTVVD